MFLPRLRERAPEAALVIVTAQSDLEGVIEALRHGAADYILKPINPDSLRIRIGQLFEQRRLALAKERGDSVFRNLVEAAECMIVMLRPEDHAILYFSPFAEQLTGYAAEEVLGRSFLDILTPEPDRPQLWNAIARPLEEPRSARSRARSSAGTARHGCCFATSAASRITTAPLPC